MWQLAKKLIRTAYKFATKQCTLLLSFMLSVYWAYTIILYIHCDYIGNSITVRLSCEPKYAATYLRMIARCR